MGMYQKLLDEYYEAISFREEDETDEVVIITSIYPKTILIKTDEDGLPYLEYEGYCGTNKGLKSIYVPHIDMIIENFYCEKEVIRPSYEFEPDFELDEDCADSSMGTIDFMPDFSEAALSTSSEITKWFYGFHFLTDKLRATDEDFIFFSLMELTQEDIKTFGL